MIDRQDLFLNAVVTIPGGKLRRRATRGAGIVAGCMNERAVRCFVSIIAVAVGALSVAGCTSTQVGPIRPITITDDVAYTRPLAEPDLTTFYGASADMQAAVRNQIVTARMYIADMEYHYYEARLTREVQEEGLGATLATLGLTTASTLVGSAATKTILSGAATAVVGADKAYNEKELLSNTIQALQTQMRADRKTQAAVIYAKMFRDIGNNTKKPTPIVEYTLPMALSDADGYYQAGTIASALIGLSKTVANAEQNADQAKSQAGPNAGAVSDAQGTAAPISGSDSMLPPPSSKVVVVAPPAGQPKQQPANNGQAKTGSAPTRVGAFENNGMKPDDLKTALTVLCRLNDIDLGSKGSPARKALSALLSANQKTPSEFLTKDVMFDLRDLQLAGKTSCS
jgi:hypothetical protein